MIYSILLASVNLPTSSIFVCMFFLIFIALSIFFTYSSKKTAVLSNTNRVVALEAELQVKPAPSEKGRRYSSGQVKIGRTFESERKQLPEIFDFEGKREIEEQAVVSSREFQSGSEGGGSNDTAGSEENDQLKIMSSDDKMIIESWSDDSEDEDALIEIILPGRHRIDVESKEKNKMQTELVQFLSESILEQKEVLSMKHLEDIDDMQDEESLIEIDISMGSIKSSSKKSHKGAIRDRSPDFSTELVTILANPADKLATDYYEW